jgi:hypothetical protein
MKSNLLITLDKDKVSLLKSIFNVDNLIWEDSSYGNKRFAFIINDDILEKISIDDINTYVELIIRCHPINPKFINKYNLFQGTVELLRNSYITVGENSEYTVIGLEHKRPFGNSGIHHDIYDHFNIGCDIIDDIADYLFTDTMEKIVKFLIHHEFYDDLEANKTIPWGEIKISKNYLRKRIINKLLDE